MARRPHRTARCHAVAACSKPVRGHCLSRRVAPHWSRARTRTSRMLTLRRSASALISVGPGLLASAIVAGAAGLVASWTSGPIMLFALLLGISVNFLGKIERFNPGISFTSKFVLRLGVALLGLKITLGDVVSLGWPPLLLVLAAITLTMLSSIAVARWMGFDPRFGVLSGGATAICGASAAMALSAALPNHPLKERATLFTVVGVS